MFYTKLLLLNFLIYLLFHSHDDDNNNNNNRWMAIVFMLDHFTFFHGSMHFS